MLNEKRFVGTDIAAWFLFHPDDLAHRLPDPADWCWNEFAIQKELAAGNLIAIHTAADSSFLIRFTDQDLTESEQLHTIASSTFRLCVKHNCLFLDGGDILPSAEMFAYDYEPENWLDISNHNYRVTVYTFDWQQAYDRDSPNYVVQFQPVADLNEVDSPSCIPSLMNGKLDTKFELQPPGSDATVQSEFRLQQWPDLILPGPTTILSIDQSQYDSLIDNHKSQALILSYALEPQAIGTVFEPSAIGYRYDQFQLHGTAKQLVQLVRLFDRDSRLWAEVVPYHPSAIPADSVSLEQLKQLFAVYAVTSVDYAQRVQYPRFYAERVASLTEARELSWAIVSALNLTPEAKIDLIMRSDRDLVQQLSHLLEPQMPVKS